MGDYSSIYDDLIKAGFIVFGIMAVVCIGLGMILAKVFL